MEIAQRLRGDPGDSYVRVSELVDAGIIRLVGGTVQSPSTDEPPGGAVPSARLVATTGSLTGGGDLSADLSLSLVNDNASPGLTFYYGTDASGVKGFFALTAGTTSPLTTKGDVYTFSTVNARLGVGSNGQVLTADSTAATGLKWATPSAGTMSPLTTKGDVWGFSTVDARLPVGTNGWVITADSTQTLGLKWAALPAGLASPLTTKGDLWGFSTVDARLPIGSNGQVPVADSTQALGLKWGPSPTTRGACWSAGATAILTPANDVSITIHQTCTIKKVVVLTRGGNGSCVVDIWKKAYASYPPTVLDTITAAAKPTISVGIKYEDATLTGWTTALTAGDTLIFHLDSASTFTYIAVFLLLE